MRIGDRMKKRNLAFLLGFLGLEAVLYWLILTTHGDTLIRAEYSAIILCFLFALISFREPLLIGGLAFTVLADYCLVVCDPIQQLWGMVFFLGAQTMYAVKLHRQGLHFGWLIARVVLMGIAGVAAVLVLGKNTDALALVSLAYYVNLILNMVCAFVRFRENRLLAIGFLLFILCDTVIGLQVAAGGYLPIAEGSWLHKIIFMPFHLSWFFYLPSQVLIALSARIRNQ